MTDRDIADAFADSHAALLRSAQRLLGSEADAEDVVQDAWLRLLERPALDIESRRAWLARVMRNLGIDRLRRRRLERALIKDTVTDATRCHAFVVPTPAEALAADQTLSELVRLLLKHLDEHDAALVLLRDVFEFDYRSIAQRSGRSGPACRQAMRRALSRLRDRTAVADAPVADAVIKRFADSLSIGEPAVLFQALRIESDAPPAIDALSIPRDRTCLQVRFGGERLSIDLRLGPVVLCTLDPRPRGRRPGDGVADVVESSPFVIA